MQNCSLSIRFCGCYPEFIFNGSVGQTFSRLLIILQLAQGDYGGISLQSATLPAGPRFSAENQANAGWLLFVDE